MRPWPPLCCSRPFFSTVVHGVWQDVSWEGEHVDAARRRDRTTAHQACGIRWPA
ncbi:hypothetical protein IV77_GL000378 [Olsenella uli DSM 7084]|nr:hypothetical protein IV77_GL000378 [Olsenella uli DSM 7084]